MDLTISPAQVSGLQSRVIRVFGFQSLLEPLELPFQRVTFVIMRIRWPDENRQVRVREFLQPEADADQFAQVRLVGGRIIRQEGIFDAVAGLGRDFVFGQSTQAAGDAFYVRDSFVFFVSHRTRIDDDAVLVHSEIPVDLEVIEGLKILIPGNYFSFRLAYFVNSQEQRYIIFINILFTF
ncbi:hypothetical protein ASC93_07425 [Massilia sp. Root335]|nr:hypothetical protein ASC93_07425 [Massilia sp. Root335]